MEPELHDVILYTRVGCHLCETVKGSLRRLERHGDYRWQAVDIDSDPDLRSKFNDEVPVVFIDGRKAFKYHMDEQAFLKKVR